MPFEGESFSSKENSVRLLNYKKKPGTPLIIDTNATRLSKTKCQSIDGESSNTFSSRSQTRTHEALKSQSKHADNESTRLKKLRTIRMLSSPSQSIEVDDSALISNTTCTSAANNTNNRINYSNLYDDQDESKDDYYHIKKSNKFEKGHLKRSKSLDLINDHNVVLTHKTKDGDLHVASKGKVYFKTC